MRFKNNALLVNTVEKGLDSFRGLGLVFYYLKTLQISCAKVKHGSSIAFSSLPLEGRVSLLQRHLSALFNVFLPGSVSLLQGLGIQQMGTGSNNLRKVL